MRRLWQEGPMIMQDEEPSGDPNLDILHSFEEDPPPLNPAEQNERDHDAAALDTPILPRNPSRVVNPKVRPKGGMRARQQRMQRLRKRRQEENRAKELHNLRVRFDERMLRYRGYPLNAEFKLTEPYDETGWGEQTYATNASDDQFPYDTNDWVGGVDPPAISRPINPERQLLKDEFMASNPFHQIGGHTDWKAVKFLGMGGMGMTGLWEYTGSDNVPHKHLVVKQSRTSKDGARSGTVAMAEVLMSEGLFMNKWKDMDTTHLLKSVWGPQVDKETGIGRVIMEYCNGGDLKDFIASRAYLNNVGISRFGEEDIWNLFLCLAQGCSVLERGHEFWKPPPSEWGNEICHMDIKPENIFLTDDVQHKVMPLAKIADYGLAFEIPKDFTYLDRLSYRGCGTEGYWLPEQFTNRWNCKGWDTWEVAGNYGSKSNIWQCAAVIFQMMTQGGPPPVPRSFTPDHPAIIGRTYGRKLWETNYSEALKILVWQCLCEKPINRPSVDQLNITIETGIAGLALMNLGAGEPMEGLETNEPSGSQWTPVTPAAQPVHDRPASGLSEERRQKRRRIQGGLTPRSE